MNKRNWHEQTEDDLCFKRKGVPCEVHFNNPTGTWTCYFGHKPVRDEVPTRDEAEQWLRNEDFNELVRQSPLWI